MVIFIFSIYGLFKSASAVLFCFSSAVTEASTSRLAFVAQASTQAGCWPLESFSQQVLHFAMTRSDAFRISPNGQTSTQFPQPMHSSDLKTTGSSVLGRESALVGHADAQGESSH
jgi:hypothetical protein